MGRSAGSSERWDARAPSPPFMTGPTPDRETPELACPSSGSLWPAPTPAERDSGLVTSSRVAGATPAATPSQGPAFALLTSGVARGVMTACLSEDRATPGRASRKISDASCRGAARCTPWPLPADRSRVRGAPSGSAASSAVSLLRIGAVTTRRTSCGLAVSKTCLTFSIGTLTTPGTASASGSASSARSRGDSSGPTPPSSPGRGAGSSRSAAPSLTSSSPASTAGASGRPGIATSRKVA